MVVIVRHLEEIGNKLVDVISIVNEQSKNMALFGITEVKIANSNGTLASSFEASVYRTHKIATIQEYHVERVRLLDDTTDWYAERGQAHSHMKLPHVYERYTKARERAKPTKVAETTD